MKDLTPSVPQPDPPLWCPRCPNHLDIDVELAHPVAFCQSCGWRGEASILLVDRLPIDKEGDPWHSSVTRRELRSLPTIG